MDGCAGTWAFGCRPYLYSRVFRKLETVEERGGPPCATPGARRGLTSSPTAQNVSGTGYMYGLFGERSMRELVSRPLRGGI
eukprot:4021057-Prymnesium_polylepis.1